MSAKPNFIQLQYAFTHHCRDPENNPAPSNIEDRRMAIYRELLYNNIEGFMADNFPVIREIMDDDPWHKLIREYFSKHKASTPFFPQLPTEFLKFLESEHDPEGDFPFIQELAHYEWVESALMLDKRDVDYFSYAQEGDLLGSRLQVSPLSLRLVYNYPVHKIGPNYIPNEKPTEKSYFVVYRDRNDKVGFMELNPVTARLLESLSENSDLSGRDHLKAIAEELQHPQPEVVINSGLEILRQMQQRDIILLPSI